MTREELAKLNKRGLIPGPGESEEALLERASRAAPEIRGEPLAKEDWKQALQLLEGLYEVRPDWVPACYSNKGLRFWEAAAIWTDPIPLIQLRHSFRTGSFCRLYRREEVLAHEGVHAARCLFKEPRFEEIFAYKTSKQRARKTLGPLLRTPFETLLFFILLLASLAGALLWESSCLLLPWVLLFLAGGRLALSHHTLAKALAKSRLILQSPEKALPFLLRLTDREIALIAAKSEEVIRAYSQQELSFRWEMIRANYPFQQSNAKELQ